MNHPRGLGGGSPRGGEPAGACRGCADAQAAQHFAPRRLRLPGVLVLGHSVLLRLNLPDLTPIIKQCKVTCFISYLSNRCQSGKFDTVQQVSLEKLRPGQGPFSVLEAPRPSSTSGAASCGMASRRLRTGIAMLMAGKVRWSGSTFSLSGGGRFLEDLGRRPRCPPGFDDCLCAPHRYNRLRTRAALHRSRPAVIRSGPVGQLASGRGAASVPAPFHP